MVNSRQLHRVLWLATYALIKILGALEGFFSLGMFEEKKKPHVLEKFSATFLQVSIKMFHGWNSWHSKPMRGLFNLCLCVKRLRESPLRLLCWREHCWAESRFCKNIIPWPVTSSSQIIVIWHTLHRLMIEVYNPVWCWAERTRRNRAKINK